MLSGLERQEQMMRFYVEEVGFCLVLTGKVIVFQGQRFCLITIGSVTHDPGDREKCLRGFHQRPGLLLVFVGSKRCAHPFADRKFACYSLHWSS
jgi:hypothetical protein